MHFTVEGDYAVAASYLGLGKTLLQQIKASNRKDGVAVMELVGVSIRASIVSGQEYVHITATGGKCELYSESGFAFMGQTVQGQPGVYEPAIIAQGPQAAGLLGKITLSDGGVDPLSSNFSRITTADGRSKKSFFFKNRDPETGEYPVSAPLARKKLIVSKVNPSVYSGKTRLFVQSVFGASLDVFGSQELDVYEDVTAPTYLVINKFRISGSAGVFTADDGTYWFIGLANDTPIGVWQIRLTPCGESLSKWLVKNPAGSRQLQSQFEAYIFAGATINKKMHFSLTDAPSINPVAYGWKYNWSGSEASCVSLNGNLDGSFESSVQTVRLSRNSAMKFEGPLAELSALEKERMRWTVSSSSTVTGLFTFQWGKNFLWAPLWLEQRLLRKSGNSIPTSPLSGIGDVYGWYDVDDSFQTIRMENAVYSATGSEGRSSTSDMRTIKIGPNAKLLEQKTQNELSETPLTVTIPATSAHIGEYNDYSYQTDWVQGSPTGAGVIGFFESLKSENPYADYTSWEQQGCTWFRGSFTSDEADNKVGAIVIPFYDAEATYFFTEGSGGKTDTITAGSGIVRKASFMLVRNGWNMWAISDHVLGFAVADNADMTFEGLGPTDPGTTTSTSYYNFSANFYGKDFVEAQAKFDSEPLPDARPDIFDSSFTNETVAQNRCYTYTSAVYNYSHGSNIDPAHPDFTSAGKFIGWF